MTNNLATLKRKDQLAALRAERTVLQRSLREVDRTIDRAEEAHESIVAKLNANLAAIVELENER